MGCLVFQTCRLREQRERCWYEFPLSPGVCATPAAPISSFLPSHCPPPYWPKAFVSQLLEDFPLVHRELGTWCVCCTILFWCGFLIEVIEGRHAEEDQIEVLPWGQVPQRHLLWEEGDGRVQNQRVRWPSATTGVTFLSSCTILPTGLRGLQFCPVTPWEVGGKVDPAKAGGPHGGFSHGGSGPRDREGGPSCWPLVRGFAVSPFSMLRLPGKPCLWGHLCPCPA